MLDYRCVHDNVAVVVLCTQTLTLNDNQNINLTCKSVPYHFLGSCKKLLSTRCL